MKVYKVEVLKNSFSETIKEKDLDSHLSHYLEKFLNKHHDNGWNFVGIDNLTVDVKTSIFSKRKKINKNVAVFKKSAENSIKKSRPDQEKEALTNISLGPATKKR